MRTLTYSAFRNDLKSEMRRCRDNAEALLSANKDDSENVVVMSARDYDAFMRPSAYARTPTFTTRSFEGSIKSVPDMIPSGS